MDATANWIPKGQHAREPARTPAAVGRRANVLNLKGDLGLMDGEGSAGAAVQAESGAPIPPAREVRAAHEVLVYKLVVGDVRPNTLPV
jgi:hypothetical protein